MKNMKSKMKKTIKKNKLQKNCTFKGSRLKYFEIKKIICPSNPLRINPYSQFIKKYEWKNIFLEKSNNRNPKLKVNNIMK